LIDLKAERPDWTSLQRLVQDLITGVAKRHKITQWELEFLLDLQNSRLRKSNWDGVLRKYLRAVQQHSVEGMLEPPRLCAFIEREFPVRSAANGGS
jgi:hypothetical protein